jgi:hypothetical protein
MKPINPLHGVVDKAFDAIDQAMITAVDEEVSDKLLATIAKAHVGVTRVEMIIHAIDVPGDTERIYADDARKQLPIRRDQFEAAQNALPPLQKQKLTPEGYKIRPGIGPKLKRPRDFACPTCHAEPGTSCFKMSNQGKHGTVTTERRDDGDKNYHAKRGALSKAANDKIRRDYDRQHFGETHGSGTQA